MTVLKADVAVLGSGFGGSLTALLLNRIGLNAVLIDRARHPRFAIGESSTPTADMVLANLAQNYDLPRLAPLAKYGSWKTAHPQVRCGIKRGFSYFHHTPGESFAPHADHANELLVAASPDDERSDTHWHRADVDAFLASEVRREGIPVFEGVEVRLRRVQGGWELIGESNGLNVRVSADFVIDATGDGGAVLRALEIPRTADGLRTRSRAIFAHFENVRPWRELLPERASEDYPFACDHAALHHLIDEGWMWQLRFDSGIVSVGFVLDEAEHPLNESVPIDEEWRALLGRYPSIEAQLSAARIVAPPGGLRRTGRMQRLAQQMAGANWALLPNAAGFIDPLHSTGIAQTLCGIERLVCILANHWGQDSLSKHLADYEACLRCEFAMIDSLVAGGYAARRVFSLFTAFSMLYFAGATTFERRRQQGFSSERAAFLCADDSDVQGCVEEAGRQLRAVLAAGPPSQKAIHTFERTMEQLVAPFNHVGLFTPAIKNMYHHTALAK